jgi:hypothetical protein
MNKLTNFIWLTVQPGTDYKLDLSLKVINTPTSNFDFLKNKWSEEKFEVNL